MATETSPPCFVLQVAWLEGLGLGAATHSSMIQRQTPVTLAPGQVGMQPVEAQGAPGSLLAGAYTTLHEMATPATVAACTAHGQGGLQRLAAAAALAAGVRSLHSQRIILGHACTAVVCKGYLLLCFSVLYSDV